MDRKMYLLLIAAIVAFLLVTVTSHAQSLSNNSLVNTYWAGVDSDGSPFVFEFQKSGKFKYMPSTGIVSKGNWKLSGISVDIEINGNFVKYMGNVKNGQMEGKAYSRAGRKWKWSATEQPMVINSSAPKYPPIAVAANAMGNVVVKVQINTEGIVTSTRILSGHPLLNKVSMDAATTWKFAPSSKRDETRTAQLTFIFRVLPDGTDDKKVKSQVFLSPYQAEIKAVRHLDISTSDTTAKRK